MKLEELRKAVAASALPEISALANMKAVTAAPAAPDSAKGSAHTSDPLALEYREKMKAIGGAETLKKMKMIGVVFPRVLLKEGGDAPEELLRFIVVSYGSQFGRGEYHFDADADAAAALLTYDSLCEAIDSLSDHLNGPAYPSLIPTLCRFGNRAQIRELTGAQGDWNEWYKYGQRGRKAVQTFRDAVVLSDTREAAVWAEKHGCIKKYAEIREKTPDEIYDGLLFNFGFDGNGKRIFDLGATRIEATLTADMKIDLFDRAAGKTVRSLPKKGADPELYKKFSDELSDMRGNLKKSLKIKTDQLFAEYLEAKSAPADKWRERYPANPFLRGVASLLVWTQGGKTFTLRDGVTVDASGNEYPLTDKPVKLAHPMEMKKEDVEAWQRYFTAHGLKQPFAQVWEPVYEETAVKPDRYVGCSIRTVYLRNQQRRGISYSSGYDGYDFFEIKGFAVSSKRIVEPSDERHNHLEIESIKPTKWGRRANTVIAFLDRITVFGRVRRDDLSVMDLMDGFTLAQVTEFIAAAQEAGASNVLAALLEYKEKTYPDFDPMAEFTQEW